MKPCIKCQQIKPLSDYYAHPSMADKHLNKCKDCCKKDASVNLQKKLLNPDFIIKERARQRAKEARKRALGLPIKPFERKQYPKREANGILTAAIRSGAITKKPCAICQAVKVEGHHEDYSKPLDITWLCSKHHAQRHVYLREMKVLNRTPISIDEFIKLQPF